MSLSFFGDQSTRGTFIIVTMGKIGGWIPPSLSFSLPPFSVLETHSRWNPVWRSDVSIPFDRGLVRTPLRQDEGRKVVWTVTRGSARSCVTEWQYVCIVDETIRTVPKRNLLPKRLNPGREVYQPDTGGLVCKEQDVWTVSNTQGTYMWS